MSHRRRSTATARSASRWDSCTSRAAPSCGRRTGRASSSSKRLSAAAEISTMARGESAVEEKIFGIVESDGSFDARLDPKLPEKDLLKVYRAMLLARSLDNRMLSLQRQGRIGFYVPSTGQEACQVGGAFPLRPVDWIFPAYREPGAALWRGVPPPTPLPPLFGEAAGPGKGPPKPEPHRAPGGEHGVRPK